MAKRTVGRPPTLIPAVVEAVQNDLINGKEPGTRLPAERKLTEQYKVSRQTIRMVLAELARQKLIVRKTSSGCFVSRFPKIQNDSFRHKTIAISFGKTKGSMRDPFEVNIIRGIQQALTPSEASLQITSQDYRAEGAAPAADYFQGDHIGAIVLLGKHREQDLQSLLTINKPKVAIDFDGTAHGIQSFVLDNQHAGKLMARRLNLLGHRRVAAIFENPEKPIEKQDSAWRARRDAFQAEWSRLNMPDLDLIYASNRSVGETQLDQIENLMKQPMFKRPSALVLPITYDFWPLRERLAKLKLSIPKNLSLFGIGEWNADSELTAIRFGSSNLAKRAAEFLLNRIANPESTSKGTLVKNRGRYVARNTHMKW